MGKMKVFFSGFYIIYLTDLSICFLRHFSPETRPYLDRIEKERKEKLRDNKQDNRSFFAKYVSCP